MQKMHVQIITSPSGEEMVVLGRAEYDALLLAAGAAFEDAIDIAAYTEAMAELEVMPPELTRLQHQGNSLLKALRLWRQMGQAELAAAIGTSQGYISDLESRRRRLTPELVKKRAEALDIPESWLPEV